MYIVWDPQKARSNRSKHGVDFADAVVALEDPNVFLIVHMEQDEDTIRIISARLATGSEQRQYFSGDFHEQ